MTHPTAGAAAYRLAGNGPRVPPPTPPSISISLIAGHPRAGSQADARHCTTPRRTAYARVSPPGACTDANASPRLASPDQAEHRPPPTLRIPSHRALSPSTAPRRAAWLAAHRFSSHRAAATAAATANPVHPPCLPARGSTCALDTSNIQYPCAPPQPPSHPSAKGPATPHCAGKPISSPGSKSPNPIQTHTKKKHTKKNAKKT